MGGLIPVLGGVMIWGSTLLWFHHTAQAWEQALTWRRQLLTGPAAHGPAVCRELTGTATGGPGCSGTLEVWQRDRLVRICAHTVAPAAVFTVRRRYRITRTCPGPVWAAPVLTRLPKLRLTFVAP